MIQHKKTSLSKKNHLKAHRSVAFQKKKKRKSHTNNHGGCAQMN